MHQAFMSMNFNKIEYFPHDTKKDIRKRVLESEDEFKVFSPSVEKEILEHDKELG